jgi:hypothetical protein
MPSPAPAMTPSTDFPMSPWRRLFVSACAGLAFSATAQTIAPTPRGPKAERAISEEAFKRVDTNADGLLSQDEAARLPAIAGKFEQLDANKDGLLSPEEFRAGLRAEP